MPFLPFWRRRDDEESRKAKDAAFEERVRELI